MKFEYGYGQTILSPEEADGLKVNAKTKSELNALEARNIMEARTYYATKSLKIDKFLTEEFVCELHKRMYGNVWHWAGQFRKTNKNIGCSAYIVGIELRNLLKDAQYWISKGQMSDEEIAIRFKHRIVAIHPFPNGNGRLSRFICDLLYTKVLGHRSGFTWGKTFPEGEGRNFYIKALKKADNFDYSDLVYFVTH